MQLMQSFYSFVNAIICYELNIYFYFNFVDFSVIYNFEYIKKFKILRVHKWYFAYIWGG